MRCAASGEMNRKGAEYAKRRLLKILVFLCVVFANFAPLRLVFAEPEPPPPRHAVQLDLGLAVIGLAYERAVSPRLRVQLEAQYFDTWFIEPHLRGAGLQVRPTVFVDRTPGRGLYLALYGRIDRVSATVAGQDGTGWARSVGGFAGYALPFAGRWDLRIGIGLQHLHYDLGVAGAEGVGDRLLPALDLVLGRAL
jgi:hypothetical protein